MPTQSMSGNRPFPEMPDPHRAPSFGEMGDGIEVNTDAPYGNKKDVPAGKFVQNQMTKGTTLRSVTPAETSIRNVRVADLGEGFGRGALDGSVEIAGQSRSLPKKFLQGGRTS